MADTATIETRLKAARQALRQGRLKEARTALEAILQERADLVEALYLLAVTFRYDHRFDLARAAIGRAREIEPHSGRLWQEEAHIRRDSGDHAGAIRAYRRATEANPALAPCWRSLIDLLEGSGEQAEAARARLRLARLEALPVELIPIMSLVHEGRLGKAETLCRAWLQRHPHDVEGMRLLADIGSRLNSLEEAEFLLETALALAPDHIDLRIDTMRLLRKRQKFAAALEQAKALLDRDPDNPVFLSNFAIESQIAGDLETALHHFDKVLAALPDDPATLTSRGHALKTRGDTDRAIVSYRRAIAVRPGHGDAWWSLANLKTVRFEDADIAAMEKEAMLPDIRPEDRIHLSFALGKAYEDRGDHRAAFRHYSAGNALKKAASRYRADHMEEELDAQAHHGAPALFARQGGKGCPAPDPIFIVGLPRAGSTLLEQILASHSQVDGTMELPNILALSQKLRKRRRITRDSPYPANLHDLSAGELREMGEAYIEDTRLHRAGAPFFIDKMPNNFRHIGLIHLILPNAKIIDARRNALDCCVSGWKQLFAEGQEFTYSLEDIGRYYRAYVAMMDHWDKALPGRILRVGHEAVIDDLEGSVRRLLAFCGLDFEAACLDFHKTNRAVRTASSEQVRRPINRDGIGQWRHFEPDLGPLKQALGPELCALAEAVS